jgi:hypothetical protein
MPTLELLGKRIDKFAELALKPCNESERPQLLRG